MREETKRRARGIESAAVGIFVVAALTIGGAAAGLELTRLVRVILAALEGLPS